jgi:purine-nucleoside phosphorylase
MPTPHIAAEPGDFAPAVLMPGDPKRAERMAASILQDAKLVTDVRGIPGFTGTYAGDGPLHGRPLSVMASGMGMPSMGIYATELYRFYGVKRIVRVGTAGGLTDAIGIGDVIIATAAHTSSSMNELRIPGIHFSAVADFTMAAAAMAAAAGDPHVFTGAIVSNDHFYFAVPGQFEALAAHGVLGVEMEAASLYGIAAEHGRGALTVLTVSDHLMKDSRDMTAEERETLFQGALKLAVAAALA